MKHCLMGAALGASIALALMSALVQRQLNVAFYWAIVAGYWAIRLKEELM